MPLRGPIRLLVLCVAVIVSSVEAALGQVKKSIQPPADILTQSVTQSSNPFRGVTGFEYLSISSDGFGELFRLDSNLGYSFNRYFAFDVGIPLYLSTGSPSVGTSTLTQANSLKNASGAGDVYADLMFTVPVPKINWFSTVTGTAPTGKVAAGFSTGRATYNWDNYVSHDFSRLRPFADIGVADSIYDTGAFVLPYTTFGLVTHLEGGAAYRIFSRVSLGASFYDDLTSGQQTVYSRVLPPHAARGAPTTVCTASSAFECATQTVGPAAIARDHGLTAWMQVFSFHGFDLFGGYTYSAQYKLNTFSLGVGFRLAPLFRKARAALDRPKQVP
jgi:hypothetical protein